MGQTYHLFIHQAISIFHLEHHILTINEITKFLSSNPTNETHSIIVTDTDDPAQQVILPLDICGVTMYFPTQPITKAEWESTLYPILELTN